MGGGKDMIRESTYNQKLNEYVYRLQKSGVNTAKLSEMVQNGGDPNTIIKDFQTKITEKIKLVGGIDANEVNETVQAITDKIKSMQDQTNNLTTQYGEYVKASKDSFVDIYKQLQEKSTNQEASQKAMSNLRALNNNIVMSDGPNNVTSVLEDLQRELAAIDNTANVENPSGSNPQ